MGMTVSVRTERDSDSSAARGEGGEEREIGVIGPIGVLPGVQG